MRVMWAVLAAIFFLAGLIQPAAAEEARKTPQPKFIGPCPSQSDAVQWIWIGPLGSVPPKGEWTGDARICPKGKVPGVLGTADAHPAGRGGQDDLDTRRATSVAPANWDGRWCVMTATAVISQGQGSAAIACVAPDLPEGPPGPQGEKGSEGPPGPQGPAGEPGTRIVFVPFTGVAASGAHSSSGEWAVSVQLLLGVELRVEDWVLEAELGGLNAPNGPLSQKWAGEVTGRFGYSLLPSFDLLAVAFFGQGSHDPLGDWMRRRWGAGAAVDFRPLRLLSEEWWAEVAELHAQITGGQQWSPSDLLDEAEPIFGWQFGLRLRFPIGF